MQKTNKQELIIVIFFYSRLNYNTVKSLLDSFKVLNNNGVIQFESLLSHVFGSGLNLYLPETYFFSVQKATYF